MQCHVKEEKTNMNLICLCIRHSKVVKIVQKQLELVHSRNTGGEPEPFIL